MNITEPEGRKIRITGYCCSSQSWFSIRVHEKDFPTLTPDEATAVITVFRAAVDICFKEFNKNFKIWAENARRFEFGQGVSYKAASSFLAQIIEDTQQLLGGFS